MRRTVALALALPVTLVVLATTSSPDEPAGAAPQATASTTASPPVAPIPEHPRIDRAEEVDDPDDVALDDGRPATTGTATADAEGTVGTDGASATPPSEGQPAPIEASFLVASVPEAGAVAGTGRRWRYTVEVEPALGIDPDELAMEIRAALHDGRSWARTRTLEQVGDPGQARIRVVLATPATVDELCGRVGLNTAGIYSCWNGRFAALNSWRWESGADGFPDITTYRNYLVNHEFGHGLGFGHVGCPEEGAPAPVMMQQSKGLDGCVANGWPYP